MGLHTSGTFIWVTYGTQSSHEIKLPDNAFHDGFLIQNLNMWKI